MANFDIETKLKQDGFTAIVGVDEAGRGPLAGPVVAGAVSFVSVDFLSRIDDSKKLSPKLRQLAFSEIIQKSIFGLGIVDEKVIDEINILEASRLCMEIAVKSLVKKLATDKISIIVDGNVKLNIPGYPVNCIIKGDSKSKTIAAASILAKVTRDRIMALYDRIWPQYGFLKHKGYPTSFHRQVLKRIGPSPIHRVSFSYA